MSNYMRRYSDEEKEQIFNSMLDMIHDNDMTIRQLSKQIGVSKSYIHRLLYTEAFISYVRIRTGTRYGDIENMIAKSMKQKKHKGQLKGGKSTAELWARRKEIK